MIDPEARSYLNQAIEAMQGDNFVSALVTLDYACEEFADQCDLHRARAYAITRSTGDPVTAAADIEPIRRSIENFDELIIASQGAELREFLFRTIWMLPAIPIQLMLATRGDVLAATAAQLIESGHYDDAAAELDAASAAPVYNPDNAAATAWGISATRALLYLRTQRWSDLLDESAILTAASGTEGMPFIMNALGNALAGAALAHLGSHEAAKQKLEYTIALGVTEVSAWASLMLGLSYRTAGEEDKAQEALARGMQFKTLPEITEAMRNNSRRLRISAADVIAARTSYWDPDSEPDMADFQRTSSLEERKAVLEGALAELDALDGMDSVKKRIRQLANEVAFENEQRRRGMPVEVKTRHMIFKGPPGTGKTTIANLLARLFYGFGVTRSDTMVQADRSALIGAVEGASAEKTLAKLNEARGGVIFIDEAYDLVQDRGGQADPFGTEALTTLLLYMDNNRDDIIVVIGGYEAPIERFLRENPGLKSRFANSVSFTTYTPDEMWRILLGMARRSGRTIDPSIEDKFKYTIEIMWQEDSSHTRVLDVAGNGRFARNVFEQAQGFASERLMMSGDLTSLSDEEFMQLHAEDITAAVRQILDGFGLVNVM